MRVIKLFTFFFFTALTLILGCSCAAQNPAVSAEVPAAEPYPDLTAAPVNLSETPSFDIMRVINDLCGEEIGGRVAGTEGNRLAADYISERFKEVGLEYFKGESFELDYEPHAATEAAGNIAGIVKGIDSSTAIIISAHYDTVANSPGSVDNASGVAAMLAVAYEIKSQPELPKTDIIFCAFNEEEPLPLYWGSKAFVKELEGLYKDTSNINIDCVGLKNGGDYMLGYTPEEISAELIGSFHKILDDSGIGYGSFRVSGVRSDHLSFLNAGIPSINFTQSGIGSVAHTGIDTTDKIDAALIEQLSGVIVRYLNGLPQAASPSVDVSAEASAVYMTTDISSDGLMAVYKALGVTPEGNVAVKVHTGEGEDSNHLRPEFIKELVQAVDGTIVECNTAYGGRRASTAFHLQVAEDRGFTAIADVDIMDGEGVMEIPVVGGTRLAVNEVGATFADYDYYVVLTHFKGHQMAGFGGALKNISIGIASKEGKSLIHSAGKSRSGVSSGTPYDNFTESMAEAAKSVADYMDGNMLYISVMNNISVDCDCNAHPALPDMHDIGILASLDPVALDQACLDLIYAAPDSNSVIRRIESRRGVHILEHCETLGFGSREYEIISID